MRSILCFTVCILAILTRIHAGVTCRRSTSGKVCKSTSCRTWTCQRQSSGSYACLPDTSKDAPNGTACTGKNPCLSYVCSSGSCTANTSRQDGTACKRNDECYTYVCTAGNCMAVFKCQQPPAISCRDIKDCDRTTGQCSYRVLPDYTACGNETHQGWCQGGACQLALSCQGNSDCQADAEGKTMCDLLTKRCVAPGLSVSITRIMSDQRQVKAVVQARVPVSDPQHIPMTHNLSLCELAGSSRPPSCVKVLLQLFDDGDWGHADSFVGDYVFSNIWELDGTSRAVGDFFVSVLVDGQLQEDPALTVKLTVMDPSVILGMVDQVYLELGAAQHSLDTAIKNGTPIWKALEATKELLASKSWVAADSFRPTLQGYRFETIHGLGLAVLYQQPHTRAGRQASAGQSTLAADHPPRRLSPHTMAAQTPSDCPQGTIRGKVLVLDITHDEMVNDHAVGSRQVVDIFTAAGYAVTYYKNSVVTALDRLKSWEQYAAVMMYTHGEVDVGFSMLYLGDIPDDLMKHFDTLYKQQTISNLVVSTRITTDAQGAPSTVKKLWATQKFFSSYTGRMDGTIVFINACGSMFNSLLDNTFVDLGAAAMIGWSHIVYAEFADETVVKLAKALVDGTYLLNLPGVGGGYYNQQRQVFVRLLVKAPNVYARLCRCRCGRVCCEDMSRPCVKGKCRCALGSTEKMCGDKCGCPAGMQCDRSFPHKEGSCVPCKGLRCGETCCNMTKPNHQYCSGGYQCTTCDTPVCLMNTDRMPGSGQPGYRQQCCGAGETCRRDGWLSYRESGWDFSLRPCCPQNQQCGDLCCDAGPGWTCADPSAPFTYKLLGESPTRAARDAVGLCCPEGHSGCVGNYPDYRVCCSPGSYCAGTHIDNSYCPLRGNYQLPAPDYCSRLFPVCCDNNKARCGESCYDPAKEYCYDDNMSWFCPIGTPGCGNGRCCHDCSKC